MKQQVVSRGSNESRMKLQVDSNFKHPKAFLLFLLHLRDCMRAFYVTIWTKLWALKKSCYNGNLELIGSNGEMVITSSFSILVEGTGTRIRLLSLWMMMVYLILLMKTCNWNSCCSALFPILNNRKWSYKLFSTSNESGMKLQVVSNFNPVNNLSLIHIWRCRRLLTCRSRWSPYH